MLQRLTDSGAEEMCSSLPKVGPSPSWDDLTEFTRDRYRRVADNIILMVWQYKNSFNYEPPKES